MNKFEIGVFCTFAVIIVILACMLPVAVMLAFVIGYLLSAIITPIWLIYQIAKGIDPQYWDLDDELEEYDEKQGI